MTISTFWMYFDETKLKEEIEIFSSFSTIPNWSLEKLRRVSVYYRDLVKNHSNHLALMISRLPETQFKSLIAEILNDEQGNGYYHKSHLFLWDNFLKSIGVNDIKRNIDIPDKMKPFIENSSIDFVVGLEGLGVECICSVYLSIFEKFLKKHPYILQHYDKVDWLFFDIHVRGEDIHHKEKIRKAVDDLIESRQINPDLVLKGYNKAKEAWRQTWCDWINLPEEKAVEALSRA
ncbi:iron-containing redox enzyme family protein [Gloeothece verrucosa]|uniref:Iron-containing redox enzyme family protein n=1 Tax=Gloeothece verrucosa (strain PCC 7822) TaxID=497965 RepID=E0U6Z5_GLOV7|nr:iron-containing redox enzyme family protein [Gloeothece verrucosa]ADN16032.1 hypothetical protein Cyan7822_4112 [Gloeothece verrucosa PCC 7822]